MGSLTNKNGDLTNKNGDLTIKNGDLTIKHCDLTNKNFDLTNKNGDLTNKNGDGISNNGDFASKNSIFPCFLPPNMVLFTTNHLDGAFCFNFANFHGMLVDFQISHICDMVEAKLGMSNGERAKMLYMLRCIYITY